MVVHMLIFSEQVLHLWLETLCSCVDVVEKWYHPWSFMRSPGWVQIKCELRLVQFFFLIARYVMLHVCCISFNVVPLSLPLNLVISACSKTDNLRFNDCLQPLWHKIMLNK